MGIGFGITGLLAFLRLRYGWWPLHPIGYLMITTFPGAHLWLSIFIGWLCQTLIVRFGGSQMYTAAKPFFLGLIVGESMAAGFWLLMGIAVSALGCPIASSTSCRGDTIVRSNDGPRHTAAISG